MIKLLVLLFLLMNLVVQSQYPVDDQSKILELSKVSHEYYNRNEQTNFDCELLNCNSVVTFEVTV